MRTDETAGFIGLGLMGRPMAANLAKAGFSVVVHNRTHEKATAFADEYGATAVESPAEVAERCTVVVTMLADQTAVDGVVDSLVEGLDDTTVYVDMSTIGPLAAEALAARVRPTGAAFVDAPVSGSVRAAESAGLTIMVGGDEDTVAAVRPVLEAMSSAIYHLGPVGAGQVMKLSVNTIVYGLSQAISEALVLAEQGGVDRAMAYDVFSNSAVAAPLLSYREEEYVHPDDARTTFMLRLAQKDLRLITDFGGHVRVQMPQARAELAFIDELVDAGQGEENLTATATWLRRQAQSADQKRGG